MARGIFTLKQHLQGLQQRAWTGTMKTPAVDYLVVAGGGGGGRNWGGGGGAGGLLQGSVSVAASSSITVTVGAGGTGDTSDTNPKGGTNGNNSVFGSISTLGGGLGGSYNYVNGGTGGSGGGQGSGSTPGTLGQGTSGQGNAGGASDGGSGSNNTSGGGGGAGTVGLNATNATAGKGGAGIASGISGTVTTYAGGGGGTSNSGGTAGTGGVGGGGNGGKYSISNATSGLPNTGGGGGGAQYSENAGAGGSGIVIVSYPDVYAAAASTTGSPTVSTSGSGSLSYNGSSQYLQIANNAALQFGTNSFTVEGWFYLTAATYTNNAFFSIGQYNSGILLRYVNTGSNFDNLYINGTQYNWSPGTNFTLNQWNHVALVRNGSACAIYVNGTSVYTFSNSNNISQSTVTSVGTSTHDTSGESWTGYISNFRIINGSAVYTGNFTPPTRPLTAIANTAYLLNTVSGAQFADSSTNAFVPVSTTNPTWNQLSPFATGLGYKNRVYTWTSSGSITF
jgi:hypothetical protein